LDDVCHVTRAETSGNRQLNGLQQLFLFPNGLKMVLGQPGPAFVGLPTTATLTDYDLGERMAFCVYGFVHHAQLFD